MLTAPASLTINLAMFAMAFGNLVWASYSGFCEFSDPLGSLASPELCLDGRRPIYLCSLPTLCIGSVGVANSNSVVELLGWRVVQALGCSSGMSVGAAVAGDLYALEERGEAMGIFFGVSNSTNIDRLCHLPSHTEQAVLIGPAIAPLLGGSAVHFASWRVLHLLFALLAVVMFVVMYCFLPETSHPGERGADKMFGQEKWRWHWVNPFKSLALLRAPNLLISVCVDAHELP